MKVFKLAAGLAVGYVLGSRAGRDKYEQIVGLARKAQDHPAVTQAQQKAKELLGTATNSDPVPADAQPAIVSESPVPRPPRRPKTPVTTPASTIDPLA